MTFVGQYSWEEINFPSERLEKFETNNKSIALNVLFAPHRKQEIRQAHASKHNLQRLK